MKTLNLRLSAIFILLFIAYTPNAAAQIVYTDVVPDSVFNDANGTLSLDLNKDGIVDFKLITKSKTITAATCSGSKTNKYLRVSPADTHNAVLSNSNLPSALSLNATIDSGSQIWKNTASQLMGADTFRCNAYMGGGRPRPSVWVNLGSGNFRNTTDKYLAVRFYAGTQLYYGWIRFSVTSNLTVTLKDYAYQSSGAKTILAGQTNDNYIITSASKISKLCAIDTLHVGYIMLGNFDPANVVLVELSDSIGNFTKGTIIGSKTSNISGSIPCVVPLSFSGTGFRFRVITSNPARIAMDNGTNLIINNKLPDTLVTPTKIQPVCADSFFNLSAPVAFGNTYQWKKDSVKIAGSVYSTFSPKTSGSYSCDITNACGTVHSNVVSVTILPLPVVNVTPSGNLVHCWNVPLVLRADSIPGALYQWIDETGYPIAGANKRSITASPGNYYYAIVVKAPNGCMNYDEIYLDQSLDSIYLLPTGPLTMNSGDIVELSSSSDDETLSYQWYKDSILIPGATGMTYTANSSGIYQLNIIDDYWNCSQRTSGLSLTVLNFGAARQTYAEQISLKIQPNPFTDNVFISFSIPEKQNFSVKIVDLAGRVVKTIATDVSGSGHFEYNWMADDQTGKAINAGIYFLLLEAKTFSKTEKLILLR